MRIDGTLLAVSVDAIREVIPGCAFYSPMPVQAIGLRGAVRQSSWNDMHLFRCSICAL